MVNQLITIGEAADLVNKSAQTIRRLIKNDKIKYKRKRTPQGFNYVVDKASLLEFFRLINNPVEVVEMPAQTTNQTDVMQPLDATIQKPKDEIYMLESEEIVIEENEPMQEAPSPKIESNQTTNQEIPQQKGTAIPAPDYTNVIEKLIDQHRQDKDKLYQLLEVFQNRIVSLEDHIRLLAAPKKKWWEIWK